MKIWKIKLDKRNILTLSVVLVIFVMSLGYAALSQHMDIDGIASIDRSWIVKITNVTCIPTESATATETHISNTVTIKSTLNSVTASVTCMVTLENQGNIKAKLGSIEAIEDSNSNITHSVSGVKEDVTILNPGESNIAEIVISYRAGVTSTSSPDKDLMLTFNYIENSGNVPGNSGNSEQTTLPAYMAGDIVKYDAGMGEEMWVVTTPDDDTSKQTVRLMRLTGTVCGTSSTSPCTSQINNLKTIYKSFNAREPRTDELAVLAGETFDIDESPTIQLPDYLYNFLSAGQAYYVTEFAISSGAYYGVVTATGAMGSATDLSSSFSSVQLHPSILVHKVLLVNYNNTKRYNIGDYVTLVDGSKWIVTKRSDVGVASVTLVSTLLLDVSGDFSLLGSEDAYTRAFDLFGATQYNKFSTSNIGYFVENSFLPTMKRYITKAGGNADWVTARILTEKEFNSLKDVRSEANASLLWHYNYSSFWLMPSGSQTMCFNNGNEAIACDAIATRPVKPVITTLKDNIQTPTDPTEPSDTTGPLITISSANSTTYATSRSLTLNVNDSSDLSSSNSYQYYLSSSSSSLSGGSWTTYTRGSTFSIGSGKTGIYYLFVKQVADVYANKSTATNSSTVTISGTSYHRYGPYYFDNTPPTINISAFNSVLNGYDGALSYTVTISDSNSGVVQVARIYNAGSDAYTASSLLSIRGRDHTGGTINSSWSYNNTASGGNLPSYSNCYYVYVAAKDNAGNQTLQRTSYCRYPCSSTGTSAGNATYCPGGTK